jgi:hypothetical protein
MVKTRWYGIFGHMPEASPCLRASQDTLNEAATG